jgi:hypothetical protein
VSLLEEIMAYKRQETVERKTTLPLEEVRQLAEDRSPAVDFVGAGRGAPAPPARLPISRRASRRSRSSAAGENLP